MIGLIITGLLTAVVLELNKNSLAGWIIMVLILGFYYHLIRNVIAGKSFSIRFVTWTLVTAAMILTVMFTQGPYRAVKAVKGKTNNTDIITVAEGQLTGVYNREGTVEIYTGIPYAAPPVGELRWKQPQPAEKWTGVRVCDQYAPMSMQVRNPEIINSLVDIIGYHDYSISLDDNCRQLVSEDSLYLNIWKPAGPQKDLPVLVYIHGGSLQTGQPWYADYSGEGLAEKGIIVVNMGYRLGVFGFYGDEELMAESPDHTTGNYGLLDQIAALQWVQKNIRAFGGDPDNVTLAGESAGSVCVSALTASPLAEGLFRRAIMESSTAQGKSPAHSFRTMEDTLKAGAEMRSQLNVTSLEQLRSLPADQLVQYASIHHHLTIDGYALEKYPYQVWLEGKQNGQEILHGYNATEGALFLIGSNATMKNYEARVRGFFGKFADEVLQLLPATDDASAKENWMKIYSAVFFSYGHYRLSEDAIRAGVPVYSYYFTRNNRRLGANHGGEEVYFYNNVPDKDGHYEAYDYQLEETMSSYFVNFIRTGDPNGPSLVKWESAVKSSEVFELGDNIGMREDEFIELCRILDRLYEVDY